MSMWMWLGRIARVLGPAQHRRVVPGLREPVRSSPSPRPDRVSPQPGSAEREYLSAGEAWASDPRCTCRPTSILYWELSEADTTGCIVHWVDWVMQSYPDGP